MHKSVPLPDLIYIFMLICPYDASLRVLFVTEAQIWKLLRCWLSEMWATFSGGRDEIMICKTVGTVVIQPITGGLDLDVRFLHRNNSSERQTSVFSCLQYCNILVPKVYICKLWLINANYSFRLIWIFTIK